MENIIIVYMGMALVFLVLPAFAKFDPEAIKVGALFAFISLLLAFMEVMGIG